MEDPEKANIRAAQEYDAAEEKHIHQRLDSIHLLAEMFECSTDDVEVMLSLLRTHGVYEIIEAVEDSTEGTPIKWSFGTVVIAAKDVTRARLDGEIPDDLHRELAAVRVSTKPEIYGTALEYSDRLNEETMMAFSDMIKYGVNLDRINALVRAYNAIEV